MEADIKEINYFVFVFFGGVVIAERSVPPLGMRLETRERHSALREAGGGLDRGITSFSSYLFPSLRDRKDFSGSMSNVVATHYVTTGSRGRAKLSAEIIL